MILRQALRDLGWVSKPVLRLVSYPQVQALRFWRSLKLVPPILQFCFCMVGIGKALSVGDRFHMPTED
jgi:hypothetical protein